MFTISGILILLEVISAVVAIAIDNDFFAYLAVFLQLLLFGVLWTIKVMSEEDEK